MGRGRGRDSWKKEEDIYIFINMYMPEFCVCHWWLHVVLNYMYCINILVKTTCYLEMHFVLFGNKTNIYIYTADTLQRCHIVNMSQITGKWTVCLTVCLVSYQRKHRRPYGPLWGESTGDWWVPAQMTSNTENFFYVRQIMPLVITCYLCVNFRSTDARGMEILVS